MRAALYARVSTADHDQDPETQLHHLRNYAKARGFDVVREYVDIAGATDMKGRTSWRQLNEDVRRGGWDTVIVYKLDRAWRSTSMMLHDLETLESHGKGFVAATQPIDTTSSTGRLTLQILSAVAEFERELIRERTRAGLERARANGKRPGRPPGSKDSKPRRKLGYLQRWDGK